MPVQEPIPTSPAPAVKARADERGRVDAVNRRAEEKLTVDAKRAFNYASEARQLAEHCGYTEGRAAALYIQGMCSHLQSDYEPALPIFRLALELYEQLGHKEGMAKTLRATGFVYDDLGDYHRALDYHLRALKIDEATGDDASRANSLRTIGIVYSKAGDTEQGLAHYQQSLELSQRAGDSLAIAKTLNNIGINLKNLDRYQESMHVLGEALRYFRETGNDLGQAGALNNLGITLDLLGRTAQAETSLRQALELSRRTGYAHGEMNALLSQGKLWGRQALRQKAALESLLLALDCAERMGTKPARCECHHALAELYKQLGDPTSALEHFETFHTLEREVFNEQSDRKLKGLQTIFQVGEAQREAEIHRLRNVELARAYEELRGLHQSLQMADQVKTELLAQLEKQNQEDGLTGLYNRRYLDERLAAEFRRHRRHRRPLSVALADIDFFKRINDKLSHAIGDETLKALANVLRQNCRETDVVARYGGEEFAIILLELEAVGAARVCEKIRKAVEEHNWKSIHPELSVTISIGVSDDANIMTDDKLLAAADAKLYKAKYHGRNQVRW